ncbi:beta ketoadipate:succinyl-CoA transferase, TR2 [Piedraia hortae CBS 480.64]|uniref:Succinyl-CoA:3-ketoacid-coenzyme A transferase n=1 Tax=Piedraia hortae CBS 480.64 TaxID=1314780 RepID=A0A6A7BYS8_9PEZI|nr:beta ketoadipate:succinyl-CoA transferase, TR2 [Piedraia hortae CBS 480.64]
MASLTRALWRQPAKVASASRRLQFRAFSATTIALREIRSPSKVVGSADEAVADVKSGSVILSAGFGLCGTPETLIKALARRKDLRDLTVVSNNAGTASGGGLSPLINAGAVSRAICSFLGSNKTLEKKYLNGEISIELTPQGTLAEKLRAAGAGIPAFFTPTGVDTFVQSGQIPLRVKGGEVIEAAQPRETRIFNSRVYNMETALPGDVAILRAQQVDEIGNCRFRYATRSFGPLQAKAAKMAIVEADEIVRVGTIKPEDVHLPGVFIDRIVQATESKEIEIEKMAENEGAKGGAAASRRNLIARRAAKELKPGFTVNLGIGMPTLAASFLPADSGVTFQSENGILGMGPYPSSRDEMDPDIINAGKETVTLIPGASVFDSAESFGMIRGGHVDVSMLGALQVGANGDLANYMIPGKVFRGMGGAMDLVSNPDATKIVVLTDHVDRDGKPKIVANCSLPLTGARCVSTIITDLCVFEVDRKKGELWLVELAPGVTVEEVKSKTEAEFKVKENLGQMEG